MTDLSDFVSPGAALAVEAGRRAMDLLKDPLVKTRKADRSLVTNADHAANDILRSGLRRHFPTHALLSEETGFEGPPAADHVWLIDPLDGTRAYAEGKAGFSVMLGLLRRGEPVVGVVYDPWTERLYTAARGQGAFVSQGGQRRPARVSSRREWKGLPVITSSGFPEAWRDRWTADHGVAFLEPINSVGVKVGYLVRGEADLYINHHPVHYWDTAGPLVILEEAGGRMTQWDGSPLTYVLDGQNVHAQPTVATNNQRHEEWVNALRRTPVS